MPHWNLNLEGNPDILKVESTQLTQIPEMLTLTNSAFSVIIY